MTREESLRRFGLVPSEADLPAIRALLAQEVEAELADDDREDDLARLCCVQLFSRGALDDVLRIWAAKSASMDLDCVVDVQFLCGAGLDATKRYLAAQASPEAAEALRCLEDCEAAGDFLRFSPQEHLAHYRRYFGLDDGR